MTRIKRGVTKRRRHKKMLKLAKGHQGVRHSLYRRAHESVIHALQYAYAHRKERKGDMRRLWNIRINAGARANGFSYSKLIHGLKLAGVDINRQDAVGTRHQRPGRLRPGRRARQGPTGARSLTALSVEASAQSPLP